MKYDERTCKFNMDTGCVELLLGDGRMISINCTGVEDALDVTMAQRTELDYLVFNDPLGVCRFDFEWRTGGISSECSRKSRVRRLKSRKAGKIRTSLASFYQYMPNLMCKPSSPGIPVASYDKAQ